MQVEHEPRGIPSSENNYMDFSAIENQKLREFLEEFASDSPVPLDSPIKVWDAVQVCFDRLRVSPTVGDELKDLPGDQAYRAAKQLSIFVQRKHILRFDPAKEKNGYGEFKTVKGDSLLALAAVCHVFTQTNFLKESHRGSRYPQLNPSELLEKIESIQKSGIFGDIIRPQNINISVWSDDFKKRMQDLEVELESERREKDLEIGKKSERKQKYFLGKEQSLQSEGGLPQDEHIAFSFQTMNERTVLERVKRGIEDGNYREWTTEKLMNLDDADYEDPVYVKAPMTEDVYFMIREIMVVARKRAEGSYGYEKMQREITYREYRDMLAVISIIMRNTEEDLIMRGVMSREDKGTLLLSDVFRQVWRSRPDGELDFPRQSS